MPQTCEVAVPSPLDAPPIRSPQAVHSFIASRLPGKDLVEIGTRNGDGMSCFALHARKATAIITRTLFVSLAMVESTAIFCLVIALILIFANPFSTG